MRFLLIFFGLLAFSATDIPAQETASDDSVLGFKTEAETPNRSGKEPILQTIIDSIGKSGIANITDAEQVFCYEVASKPLDYNGYTIDNMAVSGFCGVINESLRDLISAQLFSTPDNISFGTTENCVIRPKLMLRFTRGVDFTDVLLSSPCHSFSIFYGGKVKTYNFKPGAEIIDTMVESFKAHHTDFISPALLNQLMPVGIVQNEEQKQLLESKSGPIRNWLDETEEPSDNSKSSGWNKLNK